MLVFDRFPNKKKAIKFSENIKDKIGLDARVFDSQDASDEVYAFPYGLQAPIVLVQSHNLRVDEFVEGISHLYGGLLAGSQSEIEEFPEDL